MLSKLKNFANKIKQRNKEAKEIQSDENDGLKKTIKQIKYFTYLTVLTKMPVTKGMKHIIPGYRCCEDARLALG